MISSAEWEMELHPRCGAGFTRKPKSRQEEAALHDSIAERASAGRTGINADGLSRSRADSETALFPVPFRRRLRLLQNRRAGCV
jgi:hypothetical protein